MAQINKVAASADISASDMTAADAGGDFFENEGKTRLKARNTSGSSRRVRVAEAQTCNFGHALSYVEFTVLANGVHEHDQTFPAARFGGRAQLSYPDGVSGLSLVAVRDGAHFG